MNETPEIPPEMKSLYIERRKIEVIECAKACAQLNFSFLEKIGHQVKGNAISFGFESLAPIAENLEIAAQHKDLSEIQILLKDLEFAVAQLKF